MVKPKNSAPQNSSESESESNNSKSESESKSKSSKSSESDSGSDTKNNSTLKERVTAYIKIDDLIREKRDEIKELSEKKIKYEEFIRKYLEDNDKDTIETNDGEIVYKKQTTKTPLKEELISKAIIKKIEESKRLSGSGQQIATSILDEINKLRGVNVKNNIRRIKKKSKSKK